MEFPVYEAIPKGDFVYYRKPKDLLKMFVKSANSYKNTPPCPTQGGKIIPCATLRLKLGLKNIKRLGHFEDILDVIPK